jgi:membrane protein
MRPVRLARDIVVDAAMGWFNDEAMSRGAAIAFYTIFSLVPCVILVTAVAGLFIGREVAQGAMVDEVAKMIGRDAATILQTLVGATTVFAELQPSLNRI